jgi:hypothetical protein
MNISYGFEMQQKTAIVADLSQKTWIPEGSSEYKQFKLITRENDTLVSILQSRYKFTEHEVLLDVGGRDGEVAFQLQHPQMIDIVDPDPTIEPKLPPRNFLRFRAQDVPLPDDEYSLIICSHVLGYLGTQGAQKITVLKLLSKLRVGASMILFYNTNDGYMSELLNFAQSEIRNSHYDYLNQEILDGLPADRYKVSYVDLAFQAQYHNFEELARCCWFLFGSLDQDVDAVAKIFLPKLVRDLIHPTIVVNQRIATVQRSK